MTRPFAGINGNRDLLASYDTVVIGGGIAGLLSANLLAREGLKVLLVEQHYVVGGYCSTFRRNGFVFDAASHFYPLLGNKSSITGRLLSEIGVETQWIKMDPVDQFHLPDGTCFSVPAEFDDYLAQLKALFPRESANLDGFFKLVRKLYLLGLLHYFQDCETNRLDKHINTSLREGLDQFFTSEKLKLLLTADCPHWDRHRAGRPLCSTPCCDLAISRELLSGGRLTTVCRRTGTLLRISWRSNSHEVFCKSNHHREQSGYRGRNRNGSRAVQSPEESTCRDGDFERGHAANGVRNGWTRAPTRRVLRASGRTSPIVSMLPLAHWRAWR